MPTQTEVLFFRWVTLTEQKWISSRERRSKYSPFDEAAGFAAALGRDVTAVEVPRAEWEQRFRREGMLHPEARIRMLDGFNEGWIDFQREGTERRKGSVEFAQVLSELAAGV